MVRACVNANGKTREWENTDLAVCYYGGHEDRPARRNGVRRTVRGPGTRGTSGRRGTPARGLQHPGGKEIRQGPLPEVPVGDGRRRARPRPRAAHGTRRCGGERRGAVRGV